MRNTLRFYSAFTLMEILVVMTIIIVLGGLGLFAFGGLRDTILVNRSFTEIKQDVAQIRQDAMLLQKDADEGWIYGIGIDFNDIQSDGSYGYFKWCSGFAEFGHPKTKSDIPGYDESQPLAGDNGYLPYNVSVSDCTSGEGLAPYTGYDNGKLLAGYDVYVGTTRYVLFESSTGRAFLYDEFGTPLNYTVAGEFVDNNMFVLGVKKNQGKLMDMITVAPLSGEVLRVTDGTISYPEDANNLDSTPEQELTLPVGDPDPNDFEIVDIDSTDITNLDLGEVIVDTEGTSDQIVSFDDKDTVHIEPIFQSEF